MKHVQNAELWQMAAGEATDAVQAHVAICPACAVRVAELTEAIAQATADTESMDDTAYGAQMWAQVRSRLTPRGGAFWNGMAWPRWRLVAAALVLVAVGGTAGVVAGRIWERSHAPQQTVARQNPPPDAVQRERVLVVVLDEHVERSTRLLVELKHADGDRAELGPLREEAAQLLKVNAERSSDAAALGDGELTAALDQLEPVLKAVATMPDAARSEELARLERRLNAEGLLFDLRVLAAHRRVQKGDRL